MKAQLFLFTTFLLATTTTGCEEPTAIAYDARPTQSSDLDEDLTARTSWDGTPEGIGSLRFLNHESTTLEVLDDEVPLDLRAATNLIESRDGEDATYGTDDDDLFRSFAEVDAVHWVGEKSIERIIDFADADGWTPQGDELLGTWDKVSFTADEALLTMELVNFADEIELDDLVALDRRAVDSILDARPLPSVAHTAALYYVGTSALTKLKLYAADTVDLPELSDWR